MRWPRWRDAMAELIIVREAIRQCGEAADFFEQLAAREHRRAEGEIERLEVGGLQNLLQKSALIATASQRMAGVAGFASR